MKTRDRIHRLRLSLDTLWRWRKNIAYVLWAVERLSGAILRADPRDLNSIQALDPTVYHALLALVMLANEEGAEELIHQIAAVRYEQ